MSNTLAPKNMLTCDKTTAVLSRGFFCCCLEPTAGRNDWHSFGVIEQWEQGEVSQRCREEWVGGEAGARRVLPCDPGDTRPHNLQVGADAETEAFVFCFVFFPSAWARFCHDGLL